MPCLKILTNLPKNKIPSDFVDKIIPVLSKVVGKPAENFICVIAPDCLMSFRGDATSPGATATLESIGHISPDRNRVVVKEISEFVEREMGIEPSRFFLTFYDVASTNVGLKGNLIG